jgi:hypothetical protein
MRGESPKMQAFLKLKEKKEQVPMEIITGYTR